MCNCKIKRDLKKGEIAEVFLSEKWQKSGWVVKNICEITEKEDEFKYFDLLVEKGKHKMTFEIKNDLKSVETGRLAFEITQGKDKHASGILSSKADFWVHFYYSRDKQKINGFYFIADLIELRKWILTMPFYNKSFFNTKRAFQFLPEKGDNGNDIIVIDKKIVEKEINRIAKKKNKANIFNLEQKETDLLFGAKGE